MKDMLSNSRRADLESTFLVLLWLWGGNIEQWSDREGGKDALPKELFSFFWYARGLEFDEEPSYYFLECLLKQLASSMEKESVV